ITALTLTSKMSWYAAATLSGGMSISSRNASPRPAFATKTSSFPKASTAASIPRTLPSYSVTSASTVTTASPSSSPIAVSRSSSMSTTHTRAPSCTYRRTTARPIPEAPPVTRATSPSSQPTSDPVHVDEHGSVLEAKADGVERVRRRSVDDAPVVDVEAGAVHRTLQHAPALEPPRLEQELGVRADRVPDAHALLRQRHDHVAAGDLIARRVPGPQLLESRDGDVGRGRHAQKKTLRFVAVITV